MDTVMIDKHIESMYKISFTNTESARLREFLASSDIDECPVHWKPVSNRKTFLNHMVLNNTISYDPSEMYFEEVVYAMHLLIPPMNTEIINKNGKEVLRTPGFISPDIHQNVIIIRTTFYSKTKHEFVHEYDIYVYNTTLSVVGGIIFVDVPDEEAKEKSDERS